MDTPYPTTPTKFRRIGAGFCGSVWTLPFSRTTISQNTVPDSHFALKREDGGPGHSLTNNYSSHSIILVGWRTANEEDIPLTIQVPKAYEFVEPDKDWWWQEHLPKFPAGYISCRVLLSERIQPFPASVTEDLIHRYCPKELQTIIKESDENKDCLVRPYLGHRRRQQTNSRFKAFSLRKYPLHIDQMGEVRLDTTAYAKAMAETLAILHCSLKVDANDVEFVLAPPRAGTQDFDSPTLGAHSMWMLDSDCCRFIDMGDAGIEQAARAFWRNDPYYPRPGKADPKDQELWNAFKEEFVRVSRRRTIFRRDDGGVEGEHGEVGADEDTGEYKSDRFVQRLMERIEELAHPRFRVMNG